ncbi:MAG: M20/M25/M40 family metallo-hydrolase [Thermoleophilaceae bacterium]|nr:M20/M25/M40 family metallo-hydrolase [Thermoleophilaceae bacterium]
MPEPEDLERRTTELLQRLIRFNTVNPPGDEQACQDHLAQMLGAAGFTTELLSAVEGRPNLVARLPSGSDGPVLCLLGHVDTVLADPADWTVDPWSGDIKDGCVWGRGALDMKSQVAAEVAAAVALAEEGWRPESGELKLVITADEETGAAYGAQWLCEKHPDKVRADLVVNEGAGETFTYADKRLYGVCVAEKGVFRFTLATSGRAGHASIPRIGVNALTKMAPVLEALAGGRVTPEHSPEPDAFFEALGVDASDLDAALAEVEATDPRVAVLLEPMLGVTMTPTMIAASQKINVIPARAELRVDCRVPPELGEEHALERIHSAVGAGGGYDISFGETVVGNRSPIDTPLMESIRGFVAREDPGAAVTPVVLPGFSDSRWWREAFPDCVAYGFFPQKAMDLFEAAPLVHGADERVPISDLGLASRFYANLAEETLK